MNSGVVLQWSKLSLIKLLHLFSCLSLATLLIYFIELIGAAINMTKPSETTSETFLSNQFQIEGYKKFRMERNCYG